MDIQKLTDFFKWCSIINIGLLIFSVLMLVVASDFVYGFHGQMFSLERETFDGMIYGLIGLYKILILVFNLIPYIVLVMMGKKA